MRRRRLIFAAAVMGPGVVVMLADSDVGSLITAAQSGSAWGYRMVAPQLLLIPVLYLVQEMTLRLGMVTGKGHGALIAEHFGHRWAMLSAATLVISATGALTTEFAGVAGVGEIFGLSPVLTVPVAVVALIGIATTGSYRRAERIGIVLGLTELAFFPALVMAHPNPSALAVGLMHAPLGNSSYLFLLAANVGAVIMPWMIFYQQGAVVDKGLRPRDIAMERRDTAVGAILTQLIMIAMVVLFAAALARRHGGVNLGTVGEMSAVLTPILGRVAGRVLLGIAILGAALVASLVASVASSWGLAEVFGWDHTLNERPDRRTAKFYGVFVMTHLLGAGLVLASVNLVGLAIDVEVANAMLLPVVLGFLLVLEARALPPEYRMRGLRRTLTTGASVATMGFGLFIAARLLLVW